MDADKPQPNEFLLQSSLACELFERIKALPIIDYHSHLSVDVLATNRSFSNLTDLWIRNVVEVQNIFLSLETILTHLL